MNRMPIRHRRRGMALPCALALLLATMAIGLAAARLTFAAMHAARFEHERAVARSAAEVALCDAERDIAGFAAPTSARAALFSNAAAVWPVSCGQGDVDRGLCGVQTPPVWQTLDLTASSPAARVSFGAFTGATMATGAASLPARPPGYVIERLAPSGLYRITAIGFGPRASAPVVLQALYRRTESSPAPSGTPSSGLPPAGPPPTGAPHGRLSLREIADWTALHAQAQP